MPAPNSVPPQPGFWDAAFQGDLPALRDHIENGADVNAWPPAWKSAYQPTALSYAVWGNQPRVVKLLLQHGADPNRPDGDGNYHPLHWASYKSDHAECAQLLTDAGADISVTTKRGFTPLEIARGQNNVVSSKPGVAAVLERAQAVPRAPWTSPTQQPSLSYSNNVAPGSSVGSDGVSRSNSAPERVMAAPLPRVSMPGRLGQAWSPLASAQAAAAAQAATAFAARGVRDERAAMERAVLTAQRDAQRRAVEEQEKAEAERREAAVKAAAEQAAVEEAERQECARRVLVARVVAVAMLSIIGLVVGPLRSFGAALLGLAVAVLLTPSDWVPSLPSMQQVQAVGKGLRALASKEQPWPSQFLCPITGELMDDPVTTADGHTFERVAIERWLQAHDTSPMTGAALTHTQLAPAIALRQLIADSKAMRST